MRRIALALVVGVAIIASAAPSLTQKVSDIRAIAEVPGHRVGAPSPARSTPSMAKSAWAQIESSVLAEWTFDDGLGNADPQGWTTLDATAQVDTFFHVDDFAGLGGGRFGRLTPLAGARSLWCGARPGQDPKLCGYASLPGYGNYWDQRFESVAFPVSGDVTVSCRLRCDAEEAYDYVSIDFLSGTGQWQPVAEYTGIGEWLATATIPSDNLDGYVRLRIRFRSDNTFSDEDGYSDTDGAVIIDDLTVRDASGIVDSQDFESEAAGARATADGHWRATVAPQYGTCAALVEGSTVLQQDPLVTNATHFWGFFNGSTADYSCAGHPEQRVVPYRKRLSAEESAEVCIRNLIISPAVPVPAGLTADTTIVLQFDVYRDLRMPTLVFYDFYVRSGTGGCWGPWHDDNLVNYGTQKDWFSANFEIRGFLEPGATEFQVSLGVIDLCCLWQGTLGDCICHSHSPLVDNVRILKLKGSDEFVVTNTNPSGPGSLRQAMVDANALSTRSIISFNIPGTGPHVISCTDQLPHASAPVVIDGTTQPAYAGSPLIAVRGSSLMIDGGSSTVKGLSLSADPYVAGLYLQSSSNVVRGNLIEGCRYGVWIGGNDNLVGGVEAGEGNEIRKNFTGVYVSSGAGNTIRGNSIHDNTDLGIDLYPTGVTPNDAGDTDTGANSLLNYPLLEWVVYGTAGSVEGRVAGNSAENATVDLYASPTRDPSGHGEGAIYLGSASVALQPGRESRFIAPFAWVPPEYAVAATLTDSHGNTSEFSPCDLQPASRFVVTNTLSSRAGSLRAAIMAANASSDLSAIVFNIPGTGPHRINKYFLGLPAVKYPVIIDGFSQPGASPNTNPPGHPDNAKIMIELRGHPSGLVLNSGRCLVRGLAINGSNTTQGILIAPHWEKGVRIEGCRIGVDPTGTVVIPNRIGITCSGSNSVIGGLTPSARNIISGNLRAGISIGYGAKTMVLGNLIGVAADGATPLRNWRDGVSILSRSNGHCIIGGESREAGNVIANNGGAGVTVAGTILTSPCRNSIMGNSIYGNEGLGIDLGGPGVTANDPGDGDIGGNSLKNFPVLSGAVSAPGRISVSGTLESSPRWIHRVHCYAGPQCDASGHGEGKVYLGWSDVRTNGSGTASLAFDLPVIIPAGWWLTATATDSLGNTSEFSPCVGIVSGP